MQTHRGSGRSCRAELQGAGRSVPEGLVSLALGVGGGTQLLLQGEPAGCRLFLGNLGPVVTSVTKRTWPQWPDAAHQGLALTVSAPGKSRNVGRE